MSQVHSCSHFSNLTIFEIERIRESAGKQNGDMIDTHLTLLEKNLKEMALHCGLGDASEEMEHISNIRSNLKDKNWDKITQESKSLEKQVILKAAQSHNNGEDPLGVLPSRLYESLD